MGRDTTKEEQVDRLVTLLDSIVAGSYRLRLRSRGQPHAPISFQTGDDNDVE